MIMAAEILSYLKDNKSRFEVDYSLAKIGLFGSLARGEQTQQSDIDIIVEFQPNTAELYELKAKLKKEIQEEFNLPVDICRLKYIKPIFLGSIQNEARYV